MKTKKDPFNDPKFIEAYTDMVIEGWESWLRGEGFSQVPVEIFFANGNDDTNLKRLIAAFEAKYGRKLKYRVDGLTYISYK